MSAEASPWKPQVACPFLPPFFGVLTSLSMQPFRADRGPEFYLAALSYAQSLWMEGKPAQALLQLNKALASDLKGDEPVLREYPAPYQALVWIFGQDIGTGFMGNPVRHFQHLATRMSGPRSELRTWRAWACFHLSERYLETEEFPRDERQIEKEDVRVPTLPEVLEALANLGWSGESELVEMLYRQGHNS